MADYSPRLKEIMAEIKAVLAKHDIAGYVLLHEPGFSEYLLAIQPSWSALRFEEDGYGAAGMRVRAKREDFESAEAHRQIIEDSLDLLVHLTDRLTDHRLLFAHFRKLLEDYTDSEHFEGTHTPHRKH